MSDDIASGRRCGRRRSDRCAWRARTAVSHGAGSASLKGQRTQHSDMQGPWRPSYTPCAPSQPQRPDIELWSPP